MSGCGREKDREVAPPESESGRVGEWLCTDMYVCYESVRERVRVREIEIREKE